MRCLWVRDHLDSYPLRVPDIVWGWWSRGTCIDRYLWREILKRQFDEFSSSMLIITNYLSLSYDYASPRLSTILYSYTNLLWDIPFLRNKILLSQPIYKMTCYCANYYVSLRPHNTHLEKFVLTHLIGLHQLSKSCPILRRHLYSLQGMLHYTSIFSYSNHGIALQDLHIIQPRWPA